MNIQDIDTKPRATDTAITEGAQKLPGRQSGRALIEELADYAMKMAKDLVEQVKGFFKARVLGVLREATEPMPTPEIAARLMTERGDDQTKRSRVRKVTKRVGMVLRH